MRRGCGEPQGWRINEQNGSIKGKVRVLKVSLLLSYSNFGLSAEGKPHSHLKGLTARREEGHYQS